MSNSRRGRNRSAGLCRTVPADRPAHFDHAPVQYRSRGGEV
ncbi:hypothetical protein OEM_03010 [Mycobacterium intracellulare subsp. yongonense 05-1390]|nr:hypothetical protein OEM_03010 [Mycobacterium intracellulare subsp. yongonense 05-1390]